MSGFVLGFHTEHHEGENQAWVCWSQPEETVYVIGSPRSGKTSAYVVPSIVLAEGPCLVTSTKPDVLTASLAERQALGHCYIFDPTEAFPSLPEAVERIAWTPLAQAHTYDEAIATASVLVATYRTRSDGGGGDRDNFFSVRAEALLAALLYATALGRGNMADLLRWVNTNELAEPTSVISGEAKDPKEAQAALDDLASFAHAGQGQRAGEWATVTNVLAAYRGPSARRTAGVPFDINRFVSAQSQDSENESIDTLYIVADSRRSTVLAPIISCLVTTIRDAQIARVNANQHARAIRMVLDEITNIAPLPDLAELLSQAGGCGIELLVAIQDPAQAEARWGKEAEGFITLANNVVILPGIRNRALLETLAVIGGKEPDRLQHYKNPYPDTYSDSVSKDSPSRYAVERSFSRSTSSVPITTRWRTGEQLWPPHVISRLDKGRALVFSPHAVTLLWQPPAHVYHPTLLHTYTRRDLSNSVPPPTPSKQRWTDEGGYFEHESFLS